MSEVDWNSPAYGEVKHYHIFMSVVFILWNFQLEVLTHGLNPD